MMFYKMNLDGYFLAKSSIMCKLHVTIKHKPSSGINRDFTIGIQCYPLYSNDAYLRPRQAAARCLSPRHTVLGTNSALRV